MTATHTRPDDELGRAERRQLWVSYLDDLQATARGQLGAELREAARQHAAFAQLAYTIPEVDARDRAAAQLRFVARLADAGQETLGQVWLAASAAQLAAYVAQDAAWDATTHPLSVIASGGVL